MTHSRSNGQKLIVSEYRKGFLNGSSTSYTSWTITSDFINLRHITSIGNSSFNTSQKTRYKCLDEEPGQAFYTQTGKALQALALNKEQYADVYNSD